MLNGANVIIMTHEQGKKLLEAIQGTWTQERVKDLQKRGVLGEVTALQKILNEQDPPVPL